MRLRAEVKELRRWFDEGREKGATHLIVYYDPYDHEDERSFVMPDQSAWAEWDSIMRFSAIVTGINPTREMQFVVRAIYDLNVDVETQIAQRPPPFNLPL